MKVIKLLLILTILFTMNLMSGQEVQPFTKKKMKWIDKDKSGDISFEEMKNFYIEKKNKNGEPIKYRRYFLGLDTNNDEKISLQELDKKVDWKLARKKINKMSKEEAVKYDID